MVLADFLADRFDDALVADHGAEPEREGHGVFDPVGNVIGQRVGMLAQRLFRGADLRVHVEAAGFVEFVDGFRDEIKIGAHVAALRSRQRLEGLGVSQARADIGRHPGQGGENFRRGLAARFEENGQRVVGLAPVERGAVGLGGEDG